MSEPTEEERVMAELTGAEPEYAKNIPAVTLGGIQRYVATGMPGGHFLRCLLTNDLFGVAAHADTSNWDALGDIVKYLHNHVPQECFGTPCAYHAWIEKKREARARAGAEELASRTEEGA